MRAARGRVDDGVDLLDDRLELEKGIGGRHLQLEHEPVELIDHKDDGQALAEDMADEALGGRDDPLDAVDDEEHPIGQPERRRHLVAKVGVARCVDDVDKIMLLARRLQEQRDGRGLDREAARLLILARVRVPLAVVARPAAALVALLRACVIENVG